MKGLCARCRAQTGHGPLGVALLIVFGFVGLGLLVWGYRDILGGLDARDFAAVFVGAVEVFGGVACGYAIHQRHELAAGRTA